MRNKFDDVFDSRRVTGAAIRAIAAVSCLCYFTALLAGGLICRRLGVEPFDAYFLYALPVWLTLLPPCIIATHFGWIIAQTPEGIEEFEDDTTASLKAQFVCGAVAGVEDIPAREVTLRRFFPQKFSTDKGSCDVMKNGAEFTDAPCEQQ